MPFKSGKKTNAHLHSQLHEIKFECEKSYILFSLATGILAFCFYSLKPIMNINIKHLPLTFSRCDHSLLLSQTNQHNVCAQNHYRLLYIGVKTGLKNDIIESAISD